MLRQARDVWMPINSPMAERTKVIPLDEKRIARTAARIVRGLHFHETGRILPETYAPYVLHNSRLKAELSKDRIHLYEVFGPLHSVEWRAIGGKAFRYAFLQATDDPDSAVWGMSFWGRVKFMSIVCAD